MSVWVYKDDGTLQCGQGAERPIQEMRKALARLIGDKEILHGEKRRPPVLLPDLCGAPTGEVNAYEITDDGAYVLFRGFVGPDGFKLWIWPQPGTRHDALALTAGGGSDVPFPLSASWKGDGAIANMIASLTQAGAQPTTIVDLIGRVCRCYKHGDPLTFDLQPQRVNIELDEDGRRISRIWFG